MVAIAFLAVSAGLFYYPWPQSDRLEEIVNQPLFPEYSTSKVRRIEIFRVDNIEQTLDEMSLDLTVDNEWVMPQKFDFVADRIEQINAAVNFAVDMRVIDVITDEEQRHQEFGVIDPASVRTSAALASAGSKINLKDRNGRMLLSLIIGNVESESNRGESGVQKYFVRVADQPQVYLVDFNRDILSTDFGDWVNSDLIGFGANRKPTGFSIDNYLIEPKSLIEKPGAAEKNFIYGCDFMLNPNRVERLNVSLGEGEIRELVPEFEPKIGNGFNGLVQTLVRIPIVDVVSKPKSCKTAFEQAASGLDPGPIELLAKFGFRVPNGQTVAKVEGVNGTIKVATESGVDFHLVLGGLVEGRMVGTSLTQHAILYATINQDALPAKPAELTDAQKDDVEALRKYRLDSEAFENAQKRTTNLANELNRRFAPWIYVLDESIAQRFRPDLDRLILPSSIDMIGMQKPGKKPADGGSKDEVDSDGGRQEDGNKDGKEGGKDAKSKDGHP